MKKIYVSDLICVGESYQDTINFFSENKIKNIEFFIEPKDEKHSEKLIKILENYSLENISFHGPYRYFNLTVDEEKWEDNLNDFKIAINITEKYRGDLLVLHTNEILTKEIDKFILEKRINKIIEIAKEKNVKIAVENVGIKKNMLYNQEEYIKLIKKYNFYSLIDVGHALLNNWNLIEVIHSLKENIISYHLHNNNGESDTHQSIFDGKFNLLEIINFILKETKKANLVLEYSANTLKEVLLEDLKKLKMLTD